MTDEEQHQQPDEVPHCTCGRVVHPQYHDARCPIYRHWALAQWDLRLQHGEEERLRHGDAGKGKRR